MRMRDSFAAWTRRGVCLLSALTAARGYWETDRLWVLLDGRGAHGSTRCSLSTVGLTAEWFVLSSLQTPQKSLDLSLLTKKKVARRMICLCYNQCLKWGKKVAVLSLHWQIITFLQWKTKLGDIAVTTIYCYLFINNINVFKHVCVCVAACVRVFHKN